MCLSIKEHILWLLILDTLLEYRQNTVVVYHGEGAIYIFFLYPLTKVPKLQIRGKCLKGVCAKWTRAKKSNRGKQKKIKLVNKVIR